MSEWLTEQGIFLLRVIVAGVCGHILWWRWHPL